MISSTLAGEWADFVEEIGLDELPEEQQQDLQRAFYAGAMTSMESKWIFIAT